MKNSSLSLSQTAPIGVWGFGTSGQAITRFLLARGYRVNVYDQKPILLPLTHEHLRYYAPDKLIPFLQDHQHIVPSPGIDLRPYGEHQTKFISELDVFYSAWQKKIIGITGTIGKTTVTHLLSQLIPAAGLTLATGGNIGIGMLDLVASQDRASAALLELSSFQLEGAHLQAPDLMIITNIYPNHLDRHGSQEAYTAAKLRPLTLQTADQQALVNLACREEVRKITHRPIAWFSTTWNEAAAAELAPGERCFYSTSSGGLGLAERSASSAQIDHHIVDPTPSPTNSYPENWLIVRAALSLLNLPFSLETAHKISIPEHRLARIATHNGINFYKIFFNIIFR